MVKKTSAKTDVLREKLRDSNEKYKALKQESKASIAALKKELSDNLKAKELMAFQKGMEAGLEKAKKELQNALAGLSVKQTETKSKATRGRPKKAAIKTAAVAKRGRPKKTDAVKAATAVAVKRGRGRPRKSAA